MACSAPYFPKASVLPDEELIQFATLKIRKTFFCDFKLEHKISPYAMNQKLSKPALFQYSSMKLQLHLLKEIIAKIRSLEMGGGRIPISPAN